MCTRSKASKVKPVLIKSLVVRDVQFDLRKPSVV